MSRASWLMLALLAVVALGTDRQTPEQARLQLHFDSVLAELRTSDVSTLSSGQRSTRDSLITWLGEYRDAGAFPLNDRWAGRTPIFRDMRGVTCAMAYLIERSGRSDIVNRIAQRRNLAYIRDLTGDTSLVAWLDRSGLSVAEAARIQPEYAENKIGERAVVAAATVLLSGASIALSASNAFRPGEVKGFVGMAIGSVTVMLGAIASHDHRDFASVNVVSGGLAIVTGFYAAFRPRPVSKPTSELAVKRPTGWSSFADVDPKSGRTRAGFLARF